ncbi:MAG: lysozyme inhibitor LprI family protein [Candidatus Tectimicrobiota bacterium]
MVLYQRWLERLEGTALHGLVGVLLVCCGLLSRGTVQAQSFDCAGARTVVELAICADAPLQEQDTQLAQVYERLLAATQAHEPERVAPQRAEQRRWLQERTRRCATPDVTPERLRSCLTALYRTRIAALQAALAGAAAVLPPLPAEAEARLSESLVSAAAAGQVLLHVTAAGRFTLRAESQTGVALQLVDMVTGPGEMAGEAGVRDGRLDVLLDIGVYKLRSFGASGAPGHARMTVAPYRQAAPVSTALLQGGESSSELGDGQQLAYWILVESGARVAVEAVGRALQDLRLWRNGVELAGLTPLLSVIETRPGRPMTQVRLDGQVEPGLYLVTAYGGPALAWSAEEQAQALHLRVGDVTALLGGWAEGRIGRFGSLRFEVPAPDSTVRLEIPEPAPVRLLGRREPGTIQSASLTKNSREPVATLTLPLAGSAPARLEVAGLEGQAFRLRTLQPAQALRVESSGPHLVAVEVAGEGADEVPASAVFIRFEHGKGTVLAADAPRVGPGQVWRQRFNLRGPTTLFFEITGAGPVAAQASGPGVRLGLEPLLSPSAPRVDGRVPQQWDVEPGWYVLKVEPLNQATGVLDLTFGQPGLRAAAPGTSPPRTALQLGRHDLRKSAYHQVFTNVAPGLLSAPQVRALPAELGSAPLRLFQLAASASAVALEVPVRLPAGGTLRAVEASGAPVTWMASGTTVESKSRTFTVHIPPTERDRALTLSWRPEVTRAAALPTSQPQSSVTLVAGVPHFFDLAQEQSRSMLLDVTEGGLYRLETLGRLHTSLQLSTPFVPDLASASDNGPGHNALLQTYLRAGVYRISVTARASTGRLGLLVRPATLATTALLLPGGSVRTSVVAGRGALVPLQISTAGRYRLDLYGLGPPFMARLEDAEGWPLSPPGALEQVEQHLEPGQYRLVVLPAEVERRLVARLQAVASPPARQGHGPHVLPFEQVQKFQWREPAAREAVRIPDRWTFTLYGTAQVGLDISDGMLAELRQADSEAAPLARIVYQRGFSGPLSAGRYVVEARSLGRNDRLDYELSLRSAELQPGHVRFVALPATLPLALADDSIVSLTTFGRTDLVGLLQDAEGRVIERLTGRSDDWNIALSRQLAAGRYTLALAPVEPAEQPEASADEATEHASVPAAGNAETSVELHFTLPSPLEAGVLALEVPQTLSGPEVRQFALPVPDTGRLLLLAAQSQAELVLALERYDAVAGWQMLGLERGTRPLLALLSDGDTQRPCRLAVWAVDGGVSPFTLLALVRDEPLQPPGQITLTPLQSPGLDSPIALAQVAAPEAVLLALRGAPAWLQAGSTPGRLLRTSTGDLLSPQTERLWLLARRPEAATVLLEAVRLAGPLELTLNDGETARLPVTPLASGSLRFWRADSAFGQPGLDAGLGMGIAPGSALAQDHGAMPRLWHADSESALRLRLQSLEVPVHASQPLDSHEAALLPPESAHPRQLAAGGKQLDISLAAGMAAVLSGGSTAPLTLWAGDQPVTRLLFGDWDSLVLLNSRASPAPLAVRVTPATGTAGSLLSGQVWKRFLGASGSVSLQVEAQPGDRLTVAGAQATFLARSGRVLRGTSLTLPGSGELVLDYEPGLVAAWSERDGLSPWPRVPAQPVTPPQRLPLAGEAMTLTLAATEPVLLRVRSTAPAILALHQGETVARLAVFPAGVELSHYLAAGPAEVHLYTPSDGPLSGSLELTTSPIESLAEGLGEPRLLAPGTMGLFGFEVQQATALGVGVRSQPDRAAVRLLDASGRVLGTGMVQMPRLDPGRYILEVRAPEQGGTLSVRPALVGSLPPPTGIPPDVVATYLTMLGLTPSGAR